MGRMRTGKNGGKGGGREKIKNRAGQKKKNLKKRRGKGGFYPLKLLAGTPYPPHS
jgi:hypothetical protein